MPIHCAFTNSIPSRRNAWGQVGPRVTRLVGCFGNQGNGEEMHGRMLGVLCPTRFFCRFFEQKRDISCIG